MKGSLRGSALTVRPALLLGGLFALSLLSCGREVTGPLDGVTPRYATGLSFIAAFPGPLASIEAGAGSVVPFERVRILFLRTSGAVALDTVVLFPAGQQELSLALRIELSNSAPATGEPLRLFLRYINAAGDTVFRGGPVDVIAVPTSTGGVAPAPTEVPLTYTGPGANADSITIAPDTITLIAGDPFSFTATAYHVAGDSVVSTAPIVYSALDPTRATVTPAGAGSTLPARGAARIRAALVDGSAEAVGIVMILPKPSAIALLAGGNQTGDTGQPLADSIRVRLNATDGLGMAAESLTVAVTTGGGSVSSATLVTDTLGQAAFRWTLGATVGTQSVTVSATGATSLVVNATAEWSGPTQLAVTTQPPESVEAGAVLSPVVVEARDAEGVLVPTFTDSVMIAIASGSAGATLGGRTRVVAVAGVATFDSLTLTIRGNYTLQATAGGLVGATTLAFTVTAAAADSLYVESGGGQTAPPGDTLPEPVVARVVDAFGNGVPGVTVTFTVGEGTGGSASTPTDSGGRAAVTWTLSEASGTQTMTVSSDGLKGSPVEVLANDGIGPIVTTDVSPALDTLVSLGETTALTVQSRDVALNIVEGSYTWSSDAPAIASVDTTGVVTAVAPGAAWIHVVEAGGTRDSTRIVVDQRLSSVTVTPGAKEIYLGASFDFDAQAVDGLGVPMLTQPTFTWSVVSSAIAGVDTAGVVTGVGLGSTQIRATAGTIYGSANVTIKTPITRIAVVRDSIGFVVTDTFTVVALGRTRSYRAVAYDTLDAPMSGIIFTWESSNPSVAVLDSVGTATARAEALANGLTSIRATAQGVLGSASLRVQQVLASIELTPTSASISAGGVVLLTARGLDPDGSYLQSISGVTFVSGTTAVATVDAATGLVTGMANGTAIITAHKDSLVSNGATITVGGDVPAVISFGRDTLSIGRSASVSIPIYLSKPHTGPVTVNLAVADTFAYFSQSSITISAGATAGNATLNGRSAGLTQVFATDGGGSGYAGDTASLAVQATVRFSSSSYSLVATDEVGTQVLLTDPSPAGGTYITYAYGTAGRVEISPDPAFIPGGQLSANVVITALAGGGTTVTPVATGVSGQSSTVNTYAAVLDAYGTAWRLGAGQFRSDLWVQVPTYLSTGLTITMTSSDTTIATATSTITIPPGGYYAYYTLVGKVPGSVYVTATAPGFTADSILLTVSTPKIDLCCNQTRTTTSPESNLTVYVRDSVGTAYYRVNPLVVAIESSDTMIVRVNTPSATVNAGAYYTSDVRIVPGGEIGSAWIRASAAGHGVDSVQITVNGPKLSFGFSQLRVGAGQEYRNAYVQIPNYTATARTVFIQNSDPAIAGVPDSVVIPAGSYYQYFNLAGLAVGQVTLIATTAGHEPDTATFRVTTPKVSLSGGGTYDNFAAPTSVTVYSTDSTGYAYYRLAPLEITYVSTDTNVVRVVPLDTIPAGQYYVSGTPVTIVGVGTAQVIASAPGHGADTVSYTVRVPKLSFSFSTYRLGRRQASHPQQFYVSIPTSRSDTIPVTITQTNAAIDSLTTTTPDIPAGTYYRYFGTAGLGFGVDTLIASAPDYLPDTAIVRVTSTRLVASNLPGSATTTSPPTSFLVYATDSVGTSHYVLDTVVVEVTSTNSSVIQPTAASVRILPTQYYASAGVAFVGPGTAAMIVTDSLASGYAADTTNTTTVTGPSLSLYNGTPRLGMRQNNGQYGAYVQVPNYITDSPLVVYLVSTDRSVATVPDSVIIPVGAYYTYFQITAHDVVGTIQIQASALGYSGATVNQEVTAPKFVIYASTSVRTTSGPQTITVYATDANGTSHYVNEPVVVTLASSSVEVATVDSATVTIPAGGYYNNSARYHPVAAGSAQLSATDARVESYRYGTGTLNFSVTTPSLTLSWTTPVQLGIGQWSTEYVYTPDWQTSPLAVALAHKTAATSTADTVTIPASSYYRDFRLSGIAAGVDTITFSATGHNSVLGPVVVGQGRVDGIGGWPTTLNSDSVQVTLYTRAPNSTIRYVSAATTFTLSVDANLQFVSGGTASTPITSVVVPQDQYSVSFWLKRVSGGTANVSISATNYQTYNSTITVNSP
ncbi:MAG: Ig-like domain-containing protein [Gemmatimonadaceae bacterium]